jgi:hypothetical protein
MRWLRRKDRSSRVANMLFAGCGFSRLAKNTEVPNFTSQCPNFGRILSIPHVRLGHIDSRMSQLTMKRLKPSRMLHR